MQALYLVRHAEVDNDGGRRFIGRTDPALTPRGEAQARALAHRLAVLAPCRVASSPLRRACATAQALESAGMPPAGILPGLREIDFGNWEGRLSEEVAREEPEAFARWRGVDPSFAFPGGDSLAAAARRMAAALQGLWPEEGAAAVVVAHGGVLRLGLCELLQLPWQAAPKLRVDFASITRLERHAGHPVLAGLNDTGHLGLPQGDLP